MPAGVGAKKGDGPGAAGGCAAEDEPPPLLRLEGGVGSGRGPGGEVRAVPPAPRVAPGSACAAWGCAPARWASTPPAPAGSAITAQILVVPTSRPTMRSFALARVIPGLLS